jgi:uncharacterized protein (DUF1501 family)
MLNRRSFLASATAGLLMPRPTRAASAGTERKFLFVFCNGGWDTTKVLTPMFGNPNVDTDADATSTVVNGITFADSPVRPAVRTFFEGYGDRCCVINGMEVRSITHERCRRIILTGGTETGRDDWGSTLAANSAADLLTPYLVIVGNSFTDRYTSEVVRVGSDGQLPRLLDGSALTMSDVPIIPPGTSTQALSDAFVRERTAAWAARAGAGRRQRFGSQLSTTLGQLDTLQGMAGTLSLVAVDDGCNRDTASDAAIAFDCFEAGIARCAMVRNDGWCQYGWDTHSDNQMQDTHYEQLFGYLAEMLADLDGRTALDGSPLADSVTIVLMSEMGRTPRINAGNGRDHWTYTSAMLIGSGIRGGQVLGAMDDDFLGRPMDLGTGEPTDSGTRIVPGHLGATLLALGDIDPGDEGVTESPIEAALV